MSTVTYYAKICYCHDDEICVVFPDIEGCYTCADTREEAIENAKNVLELVLDLDENSRLEIYPASTLEELEAEVAMDRPDRWDDICDFDESYEFVSITAEPPNDIYLSKIKPHPWRRIQTVEDDEAVAV